MQRYAIAASLLLALAIAACTAPAPVTPSPRASAAAKLATRTVTVHVAAPIELTGGGRILTDGGAGLFNGGQVTNTGAANVAPKANWHLAAFGLAQAATARFADVGGAGVRAVLLDGSTKGAIVTSGEDGTAQITGLPADRTLSVVAGFKVGDKVYRVAASLVGDEGDAKLELDPINTMVEARVRELLAGKDPSAAKLLTNERLARVWTICNNAGITLAPADLEAGRPEAELTSALGAAWKAAIDSSVTNADQKAEIQKFIADLEAIGQAK